ncbi:MAG TPA: hypothetical protein VNR20_01375 [Terriglobales bacterium]|nr:hypothetical protein [Terriglobales bacterium]
MNRRLVTGFSFIAAGAATASVWVSGRTANPFAPVAALLLFLLGASFFNKTRRFADKLKPLVGKRVRVRVWGSELPELAGCIFAVQSVLSLGAGLHLYLRPLPDGASTHLKIAQPLDAICGDTGIEIGRAKYVQWRRRTIQKNASEKALVLVVEPD